MDIPRSGLCKLCVCAGVCFDSISFIYFEIVASTYFIFCDVLPPTSVSSKRVSFFSAKTQNAGNGRVDK